MPKKMHRRSKFNAGTLAILLLMILQVAQAAHVHTNPSGCVAMAGSGCSSADLSVLWENEPHDGECLLCWATQGSRAGILGHTPWIESAPVPARPMAPTTVIFAQHRFDPGPPRGPPV